MYRRGDIYYLQNNSTGEQRSLRTNDKAEAKRILDAENQARQGAVRFVFGSDNIASLPAKIQKWRQKED